ncbi:group II intron maturase-specific domain-containing protein [Orientia tsutsugamushi]|uniref:group II intron maturase-specific domain-containing protein n=1 Tax=Orientia tsutsugamushi TaxID=784 RepID=UPI0009BB4323
MDRVIYLINQILHGLINYFRIGNSSSCFRYVMDLFDKIVRHHLMQSSGLKGFCWKSLCRRKLYEKVELYNDYQIRYYRSLEAITSDRL